MMCLSWKSIITERNCHPFFISIRENRLWGYRNKNKLQQFENNGNNYCIGIIFQIGTKETEREFHISFNRFDA